MTFQHSNFHFVEQIYPSSEEKRDLIAQHLLELDEDSRINRFCGQVSDNHINNYVNSLDSNFDFLYAVVRDDLKPRVVELPFNFQMIKSTLEPSIIGLAHLAKYREENNNSSELAISVSTPHRKRGIGSLLLEDILFQRARELGIESIQCECSYTNRKVQQLFKRKGAELNFDILHNSTSGNIVLPPNNFQYAHILEFQSRILRSKTAEMGASYMRILMS